MKITKNNNGSRKRKPAIKPGHHVEYIDKETGELRYGVYNALSSVDCRRITFASDVSEDGVFEYTTLPLSKVKILRKKPDTKMPDEPLAKLERMRKRYPKNLQPDPVVYINREFPAALKEERAIVIKNPRRIKAVKFRNTKARKLKLRIKSSRLKRVKHAAYVFKPFVLTPIEEYKSPAQLQGKISNEEPLPAKRPPGVAALMRHKLSVLVNIADSMNIAPRGLTKHQLATAIDHKQRSKFAV